MTSMNDVSKTLKHEERAASKATQASDYRNNPSQYGTPSRQQTVKNNDGRSVIQSQNGQNRKNPSVARSQNAQSRPNQSVQRSRHSDNRSAPDDRLNQSVQHSRYSNNRSVPDDNQPLHQSRNALVQPVRNLTVQSQRNGLSQGTLRSQGSKRTATGVPVTAQTEYYAEEDEEEVEDEEEEEYSDEEDYDEDYYPEYAPSPSVHPKEPRAVTSDNYETCSCFPRRTNKNIPSMLYENIQCVHTGLKGQSHAGVFRFDDNWVEKYVDKTDQQKKDKSQSQKKRPRVKLVYGYPKPIFDECLDDDDEDDDEYDEEYDDANEDYNEIPVTRASSKKHPSKKGRDKTATSNIRFKDKPKGKENKSNGMDDTNKGNDVDDGDSDDSEMELTREDRYYPLILPQIGTTPPPPPSRERSRLSIRSQPALPPLPESPYMSAATPSKQPALRSSRSVKSYDGMSTGVPPSTRYSGRHSAPDIQKPTHIRNRQIDTNRRFQGVYYDPVTKRPMPYDISPVFRKQPSKDQVTRMSSRMPTRTQGSSYYDRSDILEEEYQ